ncbi:MAG: hypothetical protein ABI548_17890 [Polyangiaceae bacterium]
MARFRVRLIAIGLALTSTAACSKHQGEATPSANASVGPSASVASSAATPATVPRLVQAKPGCRALDVVGKANVDGTPIVVGSLLDGEHWVTLEAGSSVALRHTVTSREFKLIGPGTVLPCRNGAEQILVAGGQLSTSANLGVRPGAEVLIATPSGTVHYGDAALDLEFGPQGLRVRVKQGEAWLEPEARGKPKFKNPVHSGAEARLLPDHASADALLAACQTAAQHAQASAERVLGPTDPSSTNSLGARAAAQMRDRAAARTACAIAASAVGSTRDPAERQRLSESVAHADELWQGVPHHVPGQKN